jgi:hypothetical protein
MSARAGTNLGKKLRMIEQEETLDDLSGRNLGIDREETMIK